METSLTENDFKEKQNFLNSQILGFTASFPFHQTFSFLLFAKLYTAVLGFWDFCNI